MRGEIEMNDLMKKIVDTGIGSMIDKRTDPLLREDEEYQKDSKSLNELEERYMKLGLSKDSKMVIDDYIACLDSSNCRANEIYYMAGIRDAILFLKKTGLIKESL